MNRAESSLIVVNGEPGNPQLRRLSNRVKPRQTTFPDTGVSIRISGVSSVPSVAFFHLSRRLAAPKLWAKAGAMRKQGEGGPKSE